MRLNSCFLGLCKTFFRPLRLPFRQTEQAISIRANAEPLSDEELMMRYSRNNDVAAFETLLGRYRTQVFGYLVRFCNDRAVAEDLYQETFYRVIQAAGRYRPKALFRTWLFTIVRNLVRDRYRRLGVVRQHGPELSMDHPGTASLPSPDHQSNPETMSKSHEIGRAIQITLSKLPVEQREMFLLREESGLDFKSAAKAAGCSVNTAKSRMRYALLRLQADLNEMGFGPEGIE